MQLLFPCHPWARREPDPSWIAEAEAATAAGFTCHVFDFDRLLDGRIEGAFRFLASGGGPLLYRGWIMKEAEYARLDAALRQRGYELITRPHQYAAACYLPNYFPKVAPIAAPAIWTTTTDLDAAWRIACSLGRPPWIVKDYIKSAKEHWADACFIRPDADRAEFDRVCGNLLEFHGDRFEGGFVFRPFLPLRFIEESAFGYPEHEEYRLFFWRGQLLTAHAYHRSGPELARPERFAFLGGIIDSPFFTADLVALEGGPLLLLEMGDGGVCRLPPKLSPADFYRRLAKG